MVRKANGEIEKNESIELYGLANVKQYKTEVAFKTLVDGIQDNMYVVPDFQRVFRWSETQVENLAVSLIRGMPIPPIYTYRNDKGQLEILDGQQRILSMFLYYIGKFTKKERKNQIKLQKFYQNEIRFQDALEANYELKEKKYMMHYIDVENDGEEKSIDITYSKLPKDIKRKLDYTTLTIIEISVDSKELRKKYLYKIFANLNSGGEQLTQQELRNGIYQSEFYNMLYEFNEKNEKWRKIFRTNEEDKFSKDIEWLLRFCALSSITSYKNGTFEIDEYKKLGHLLNDFSEKAIGFNSLEINDYRNKLIKFVESVDANIPKKITLLDTLFLIIDKAPINKKITKSICDEVLKSNGYKVLVNDSTASRSGLQKRLGVVYDAIQRYN